MYVIYYIKYTQNPPVHAQTTTYTWLSTFRWSFLISHTVCYSMYINLVSPYQNFNYYYSTSVLYYLLSFMANLTSSFLTLEVQTRAYILNIWVFVLIFSGKKGSILSQVHLSFFLNYYCGNKRIKNENVDLLFLFNDCKKNYGDSVELIKI